MKNFHFFCLISLFCSVIFISCQKEYSLELGNGNAVAAGSLQDSLGNCLPDSVYGTFYNGVLPGDTNYVQIEVNVTTPGTYSIKTDIENGFQFADSGFFNTTGINVIKLKTLGTPILHDTTNFIVSFDSTVCGFSVIVKDSTGTGLGGGDTTVLATGTWQFTAQTNSSGAMTFGGPIDTALQGDTLGFHYLALLGRTLATGDSLLELTILFPNGVIQTGTYSTQGTPFSNAIFGFADQDNNTIYYAVNDSSSPSLITVNITSYDSATKIISGNFSGLANDTNGNAVVNISNGGFIAKVMN